MKRLPYIICIALVAFATLSCGRRELTYDYSPYCEVVVNVDWSNMTKAPNGMTVICYPESGEAPIVKVSGDNINQSVLQLPAGVYNIVVFNRQVSDFDYVGFRGMDKFETAEVYALATTSKWAQSKADAELVAEPNEVAASTYLDVEIKEECVEKSTELFKTEGKRVVAATIDLKPVVVVKQAKVRIRIKGIYNLRSARATLTGMADGYNFSTQMSSDTEVTHALESWTIEDYEYGEVYGQINTDFVSFGIPNYATTTREDAINDWRGSMDVSMLLVDNKTIEDFKDIPLENRLTTDEVTGQLTTTLTIEVGFSDDSDDVIPELEDVKPEGGSESDFDAQIDPWGDEEVTTVPL